MLFGGPGEVMPGFHILGHGAGPVYLLEGPEPVLFDAGFANLGRVYLREARAVLGERAPGYLFLTHMHFDHCGGAGMFKEAWPPMTIAASARAAEIAGRPNANRLITELSKKVPFSAFFPDAPPEPPLEFRPFGVERVVTDGERIDLAGGLGVEVLATPGHTRDFTSYYIPERQILIASEAVGVLQPDGWLITEFLVDYDSYVANMRRMLNLPVKMVCQGHHWAFTGPEAKARIVRGLEAAERYRRMVMGLLEECGGDIPEVIRRVKAYEYDNRTAFKQEETAYLLNLTARVRHLAQKAGYEA